MHYGQPFLQLHENLSHIPQQNLKEVFGNHFLFIIYIYNNDYLSEHLQQLKKASMVEYF